jgi:outer membrane immunogenic protein
MNLRVSTIALVIAAYAVLAGGARSGAQVTPQGLAPRPASPAFDLALTYSPERGKIASTPCDCFWLQGGGADAAWTFYRGLGLAASFTGQHASGLSGGASLSKFDYLFGPRFTLHATGNSDAARYSSRFFAEALFGGVHAFDGIFPAASQAASSANSFAYQLGGGADLTVNRRWSIRVFEVHFVHSSLPNNAANTQDDLSLATGINLRFAKP